MKQATLCSSLLCLAQFSSVWLSLAQLAQFGSVWLSLAQFGTVCLSLPQFGSVCLSLAQFASVCLSLAQFGSVWLSLAQFLVRIEPNGSQPCCVITPFINGCSLSRVENFLNVENVTRVQPGVMSNTTEA